MDYINLEQQILEEVPYNWKKHFIFCLPELAKWLCSVLLCFLIFQMFLVSMLTTAIAVSLDISDEQIVKDIAEAVK